MKRDRLYFRTGFTALGIAAVALVYSCLAVADEAKPRRWDQDEAVARVKKVLEIENKGELPWDQIEWETDVEKALARSKEENKPLFVYLFLKKHVGPEAAPC